MQGVAEFLNALNCNFSKESSSEKIFLNRLRFDRIVVMSLLSPFLTHPVYSYNAEIESRAHYARSPHGEIRVLLNKYAGDVYIQ